MEPEHFCISRVSVDERKGNDLKEGTLFYEVGYIYGSKAIQDGSTVRQMANIILDILTDACSY